MYNLPYISYGIFAFVLIAIWLLAWKKGFRAALCSFVLTLLTVGVIVGLSFAIYSQISPLFSSYIKDHFGGDPSYNFNYLADAAKPQVIAICIAVGFIPVYAILFGISYPIYRHFRKNDFPRLSKYLGPNSKKIRTSNKKLNKLGGVVATGVTSIASAGFAAAASGVLFTTAATYNGFNDAMSILSLGTSYGFSKDSLSLHKMYEFVPMTKDADLMKLSQVLAPSSKAQLTPDEINKIMTSGNYAKFLELISTSESEAILNVLASKFASETEKISFDGIDGKDQTSDDFQITNKTSLWRPLGNETSKTPYTFDLAAVHTLYDNVHFGMDSKIVATLVDWVKRNGIQKFEDTEAVKLLNNAIKAKNDYIAAKEKAESDLVKRTAIKGRLESIKNDSQAGMLNTVATIQRLVGDLGEKIKPSSPLNNQLAPVQTTKKAADDAHTKAQGLGNAFENYTGIDKSLNEFNAPSLSLAPYNLNAEYQVKIAAVRTAQSNIDSLNSQIVQKQNDIANYKAQSSNFKNLSDQATRDISSKQNDLNDLNNTTIPAKNGELTSANADYNVINGNLKQAGKDLTDAQDSLKPLDPIKDKTQYDQIKSSIIQIENKINKLGDELVDARNNIDAITRSLNELNTSAQNLSSAISSLQSDKSNYDQQKVQADTNAANASADLNSLQNQLINEQNTLRIANGEKAQADQEANRLFSLYLNDGYTPWKNANDAYKAQLGIMNRLVSEANDLASSIRQQAQNLASFRQTFENAVGQIAVIDWKIKLENNVNVYKDTFKIPNVWIGNNSDFVSLPNSFVSYNETSPSLKISPLADPGLINEISINDPVSQINLDTNVWGNDVAYKASYEYSIPYLSRVYGDITEDGSTAGYIDEDQATFDGKTISTKEIDKVAKSNGTAEGLIAVLDFNIKNTEKAITDVFTVYKDNQKIKFDANVVEYVDIIKKALGA